MNTPIADRRRGRRQLILLASLFFVPLLVAFWLYYGSAGWRPAGGTNQGDLINPAVPLPAVSLARPDGTRTAADFLQGKWTIAYLGDGACDERCRKALYLSRQSWIALNKDARVHGLARPDETRVPGGERACWSSSAPHDSKLLELRVRRRRTDGRRPALPD
jgi:hypothetical protein